MDSQLVSMQRGDAQVVTILLDEVKNIPVGDFGTFGNTSHPYVEMRLIPGDPVAGVQNQRSAIKPDTTHPLWEPAERFQFVVSKPQTTKILISVYHYNGTPEPKTFGDAMMKVKDLNLTDHKQSMTIRLVNPVNGKTLQGLYGPTEATMNIYTQPLEVARNEEHQVMINE